MLAAYKISAAGSVGLGLVFSLQGFYATSIGVFTNLSTPILAGVAAISAASALQKYGEGVRTRSGKVWTSFTAGILLWFLGEVSWSFYSLVLNVQIPYPSVADVFYVGGYIPLFFGFYLYVAYFKPAIPRRNITLVVIADLASAFVVFGLLLSPVLSVSEEPLVWFFDFAYPLLDLALLTFAILGLTLLVKGNLGRSWLLFTIGILLNVFADLLFSYTTARGGYYIGSLPDFLFLLGYISFGQAFYVHKRGF